MAATSSPSLSTSLAALPKRAPTPPRDRPTPSRRDSTADLDDSVDGDRDEDMDAAADALRFLEHGHNLDAASPTSTVTRTAKKAKTTNDTPPSKPPAHTATPMNTTGAAGTDAVVTTTAKKVGFSNRPTYHDIPALGQTSSAAAAASTQPVVSSPLSHNSASRPLKSILKPHHGPPPSPDGGTADIDYSLTSKDPEDFRRMLHSTLTQLEGPSRDGRRDAYMALNGSIRAHTRVLDPQVLAERMARLTQCLSRDLAWKDASGRLDTAIVQQALSLTCAILLDTHTNGLLDHDFQAFVLDRSIFVLEQADMAKAIVKGHLHLLCVQRFPRMVFSGGRAERLITVMQNLEARNSMVAARLVIYQRLIERAPSSMLSRIKDWIEPVFHALLSSVTDIQRRAIDCCTQMGMILGHHPQTAKVISELCEKEIEEGQSYGDYLNMNLIEMTKDKQRAPLVPEIWLAVVLCFRTKRYPIGKWPKFRDWLLTIQKCLNSSDMAVKRPANIAWNRLVFAVMPDSSVSEPLRSMLKVPILAGLERRGSSELSQQLRQLSLESYCNLLHYALRPDLTHEELDLAWDMYVAPVLIKLSKAGSKGRNTAFRILHRLLKKTGGTWNVNAANELVPIQPEDLPRLDVRWVRSRIARFMFVLEPMILADVVISTEMQQSVECCWRSLMAAVAEAGCQEVKASNELKESIALALGFLRRLWASASRLASDNDPLLWLRRYQSLLAVTVEHLGPGHFVDDIVIETTSGDIEAAPTSTHRITKQRPILCSPFTLLFRLYYSPAPALQAPSIIETSAAWFLRLLAGAKVSTSGLLGLLQRSLRSSPAAPSNGLEHVYGELWSAVAETATSALQVQDATSPKRDTFVMGVALKSTVSIILEGLRYSDDGSQRRLVSLYNAACQSARHVAGSGGIVLAIMEPLAKLTNEHVSELSLTAALQIAGTMAESSVWPSTRSELDQSRKALWTVSLEPCRMQVFDPFDHVYKFFDHVLHWAYSGVASLPNNQITLLSTFISSLRSFLRRCPSTLFTTAFRKLQHGIATWAEDSRRSVFPQDDVPMINGVQKSGAPRLQHDVEQLWSQLLQLVTENAPFKDSQLLEVIEVFLIAGLSSPSRSVVNSTVMFWNATFAQQAKLDYPKKLFPVLRARQTEAELILPGCPSPVDATQQIIFPTFAQSQPPTVVDRRPSITGGATFAGPREAHRENVLIRQHLAAQQRGIDDNPVEAIPPARTLQRPRVDDSQVQFAPISSTEVDHVQASEVLTEHQREVRSRQQADLQAYPGLSSSPVAHESTARQHHGKKLDFLSDPHSTSEGDILTMSKSSKQDALFNDDIQSSPTPRSSDAVGKNDVALAVLQHQEQCSTASDPPSSPPRQLEAESKVDNTPAKRGPITATRYRGRAQPLSRTTTVPESSIREVVMTEPEFPSDTQLPNAQLLHEEALASKHALEGEAENASATFEQPETPSKIDETELLSSRQSSATPSVGLNSAKSTRSSRKRKRSAEIVHSARKRKPQSPLKKLMSMFQHAHDDDIGEEIVVARGPSLTSSLPAASATASQMQEAQAHGGDVTTNRSEGPVEDTTPAPKRRRGRPRASGTASPAVTKDRKQPAPTLEPRGDDPLSATSSLVAIAPSQQTSALVTVPGPVQNANASEDVDMSLAEEDHEDDTVAHGADMRDEQQPTPSPQARKFAQPQSIIGRLRGILADCKNMILGSQEEEREFDDVLFEIRREVHEAGSRRRTE